MGPDFDLLLELDDPRRRRDPDLEVDLEVDLELQDDMLLDPWFQLSEEEIRGLANDPDARIHEILLEPRAPALDYIDATL